MNRIRLILALAPLFLVASVGPAWAQDPANGAASYDLGMKFATDDGRFSIRFFTGAQFRYSYVSYDDRVEGNDSDYSNFYIRRARLWWKGHVFDPDFTYFFHLQLEPNSSVNTHDIWFEYRFSDMLRLGLGRNKIAYGLEFLNSGFGLNLVERSVMYGETDIDFNASGPEYPGGGTARFGLSSIEPSTGFATGGLCLYRSQGIQLRGMSTDTRGPTFEYQVGLWQGRGTRGRSNEGNDHLYSIRLGFHPNGWISWVTEGAVEPTPAFRYGLLVSAYTQRSDLGGGFEEHGYNLAAQTRWRGFSGDVEWGREIFDYDHIEDNFEREGWRAQLGYFVMPGKLEVVGRYAEIERLKNPTVASAEATGLGTAGIRMAFSDGEPVYATGLERQINELTLGVNLYLNAGYRHKVSVDLSRLTREFAADPAAGVEAPGDQQDTRIRTSLQFIF